MDSLDQEIKEFFQRQIKALPKGGRVIAEPAAEDYYQFLTGRLDGRDLEDFLKFLKNNEEAQSLVKQARKLFLENETDDKIEVPQSWLRQAKKLGNTRAEVPCPHCGKAITPFKKPLKRQRVYNFLWLAVSLLSFGASFYFKPRFYQCLVLALFCGIKWILDQRATKTQILIYKALQDDKMPDHPRDLHNIASHL